MDILPADEPEQYYIDHIRDEEISKERNLQRIRIIKERSMSFEDLLKRSVSIESNEASNEDVDERKNLFETIPEPYFQSTSFQRIVVTEIEESADADIKDACIKLQKCKQIREKWLSNHPYPPQDNIKTFEISEMYFPQPTSTIPNDNVHPDSFRRRLVPKYNIFEGKIFGPINNKTIKFKMSDGIICLFESNEDQNFDNFIEQDNELLSKVDSSIKNLYPVRSYKEFVADYNFIHQAIHSGPLVSYAYKRLEVLLAKFNLHVLLNGSREMECQKGVPHRDFYNVRKVDTHVHHSACMNQKHLLRFIKHKLRYFPNDLVAIRDEKTLSLVEVFRSLGLTAYDLNIDTLDMHANNTFQRFDRFNLKYNPAGQSRLREIFLKTDNFIDGRYLAEITQEVMADLASSKYQLVEWRISIYGKKYNEWSKLAKWFYTNRLAHPNVRWLIQVPRLFHLYRKSGDLKNFEEMLYNIFGPLVAATMDPSSHPEIHYFLETIVGFDSVDDESRPEYGPSDGTLPLPQHWTMEENPPYAYYMYHMYANICALNQFRASRNLCTFQFRPHCGEAGDIGHLVSAYIVADQINHGILMRKSPGLLYLYYLSQIGVAISPLSNNKLFLDYQKSPFHKYFKLGLNVSLSTDDPLMLHFTKDALVEEYSVATQVWKLSSTDQCELARHSVLQSGWEERYKLHFLGSEFQDIRETNVPKIRLLFRQEALEVELSAIESHAIHV